MPESTSNRAEYLLGHSANEEERLRRLPGELAPDSSRFLDQLGIQPGDQAVDIGCGHRGFSIYFRSESDLMGKYSESSETKPRFSWPESLLPDVSCGMWKCCRQTQSNRLAESFV